MRRVMFRVIVWACWAVACPAADNPFAVRVVAGPPGTGDVTVSVSFTVPPLHHLYADTIAVEGAGVSLSIQSNPPPARIVDSISGELRESYTADFTRVYAAAGGWTSNATVTVSYQGCSEDSCFFPQSQVFELGRSGGGPDVGGAMAPRHQTMPDNRLDRFSEAARSSGYMRPGAFLEFLDAAMPGVAPAGEATRGSPGSGLGSAFRLFAADPVEFFKQFGRLWTLALILVGGLLLNLTPCVLPMIPINLAIIGVGAQGTTRLHGLWLGTVYGAGIALVYGLLGGIVVLTGATFGALNSMPVFNAAIAVVFVLLGLAMFDVFALDLSRFQSTVGEGIARRGKYAAAFGMGGLSALLAGACVAPVVIAVLVLSGNLYAQGLTAGMLLPFALGVGMALPWPLAGAGLALLPKPGAWMKWVKYGFGVLIFLMAFYYGHVAYKGWRGPAAPMTASEGVFAVSAADGEAAWDSALSAAGNEGKPVFVDFWATWCKNCEAMEATTFRDTAVAERMKRFVVVKCQAESPDEPRTRAILERFNVKGLPTYLVLRPRAGADPAR